ncbi:hydrogenase 2 accessory protein HypG [compost metagenome]
MLLEEPLQVGDYVLLHIGFVMSKIDEEEAQASLESFRQMVALIPAQDILPC